MTNYLVNDCDEREETVRSTYYVYYHYDNDDEEIVYFGHGFKGRAWIWGSTRRCPDHDDWMEEQDLKGYLPCDFVTIVRSGLTKTEACKLEQQYIRAHKPRFNKAYGAALLKMTPELVEAASAMRSDGMSYSTIAKELDVSTMSVYRALNGQTKNIGEIN